MKLSSLADYAVVLMRAAACHCGGERASAAALAEETGIPVPTAQKLVSLLGRAGLLKATRGSGGGIELARPADAITLAQIIEAIEGPIAMTACVGQGEQECCVEGDCQVKPHWGAVNASVRGVLDAVSLASMIGPPAAEAQAAPLAPVAPAIAMEARA